MGGMQQMSQEQMRNMIQEEAWKMSHKSAADQMLRSFDSQVEAARDKYPDIEDKLAALNLKAHPEMLLWTNGMDNAVDILADLSDNPSKYASILMLAKSGAPELAQKELSKLSSSIRVNQEAKKQTPIPAPLDQVKTSPIAVDNGNMSVADFRKLFRG